MNGTAVTFIKAHEGCRLTAYQDSIGVWTIGYGHTAGVHAGMTCIQQQADDWLAHDMDSVQVAMKKLTHVNLSEEQEAAIISIAFNLRDGPKQLAGSMLMFYTNQRQWIAAAKEFPKWDHAGKQELRGLLIRRFDEAALFLRGS